MIILEDGEIIDFCCDEFNRATLQPNKTIAIDLFWKDHFLDKPHPRACLLKGKSGVALQEDTGITKAAGLTMIPIEKCPFCNSQILFESSEI